MTNPIGTPPREAARTNTTERNTTEQITTEQITTWVERYVTAWTTNDADDIAALFTIDGEYHESPFDTVWIGRDQIVDGWQGRWDWQKGGWAFEWSLVGIDGLTAVVTGVGHYRELGDFDNHWSITFRTPERASLFVMVNTERDADS